MRTLEEVDRAIELARYDMKKLMKMRQPISIVGEELSELYDERREILKANKRAHWMFGWTMGHSWMNAVIALWHNKGRMQPSAIARIVEQK